MGLVVNATQKLTLFASSLVRAWLRQLVVFSTVASEVTIPSGAKFSLLITPMFWLMFGRLLDLSSEDQDGISRKDLNTAQGALRSLVLTEYIHYYDKYIHDLLAHDGVS